MAVRIKLDNETCLCSEHGSIIIGYCRILTSSCLRHSRRLSLDNHGFFGLTAIIKFRPYSVLCQSAFTLLPCNLRTDIDLETVWQKMVTANIAVLHRRHIRSSDPLQPCFPSLLV